MPLIPHVPGVVLDTNVVLDWLVFSDAGMSPWAEALVGGQLRWLACGRMRQELQHTLVHAALGRWQPDCEQVLQCFDRHACLCPDPPAFRAGGFRCSDANDQVFIDLALAQRAQWLLTHDRALLRLARRARVAGLRVLRPTELADPLPPALPLG